MTDMREEEREAEKVYHIAMQPLTMCLQQQRKDKHLEKCLYYASSGCSKGEVTGNLIQMVRNGVGEIFPMWIRNLKSMMDGSITVLMPPLLAACLGLNF